MPTTTNQPKWKAIAQLGDVDFIDYGGYFVLEDKTGRYPHEGEYVEVFRDDYKPEWRVYRFALTQCTYRDGVLSDNKYHPDQPAWFAESVAKMDTPPTLFEGQNVRDLLCSSSPYDRAIGWREIGEYHGFENLDDYPLVFTKRSEVKRRYRLARYRLERAME